MVDDFEKNEIKVPFPEKIPGYRILRPLGQGGMASVYLAIEEKFEREVALKIMSSTLATDMDFVERFLREARIVANLVHPNIVTVHDVGVYEGISYLGMEYIPGTDLKSQRLELNLLQSLSVIKDVASALNFAASKGVVHRDVKPENIMLHGRDGHAVLMDFGIARAADSSSNTVTRTGMVIGTPQYMSPEQAKGLKVDSRGDLYSLGVVFFQLLTGKVPYTADSAVAIGIKHITEPVPLLPESVSLFQPIINCLLAKHPEQRFENAEQLIKAIESIDLKTIEGIEINRQVSSQRSNLPLVDTQVDTIVSHSGFDAKRSIELSELPTKVTPKPHTQPEEVNQDTQGNSIGNATGQTAFINKNDDLTPTEIFEKIPDEFNIYDKQINRKKDWNIFKLVFVISIIVVGWYFYIYYLNDKEKIDISTSIKNISGIGAKENNKLNNESDLIKQVTTEKTKNYETIDKGSSFSLPQPYSAEQKKTGIKIESNKDNNLIAEFENSIKQLESGDFETSISFIEKIHNAEAEDNTLQIASEFKIKAKKILQKLAADKILHQDFSEADTMIITSELLYGSIDLPENLHVFSQQWNRYQEILHLLDKAEIQLGKKYLSKPIGNNALETYRTVLAIDENNEDAIAGILNIQAQYINLTQNYLDKDDLKNAKESLSLAIKVARKNNTINQLESLILSKETEKDNINNLMTKAFELKSKGKIWQPIGESSADIFQQILFLNSDYTPAKKELELALNQAESEIDKLLESGSMNQASLLIEQLSNNFSNKQQINNLQNRYSKIKFETLEKTKPKLTKLLVSGMSFDSFDAVKSVNTADRTIYIGLEYKNFSTSTTVLQAVLFDGAKTTQIAQAAVIINGSEGKSFFQIERPVDGYPPGSYTIDLVLNDNILKTKQFVVE